MIKPIKTYEFWRIPMYLLMILIGITCFFITIFIEDEHTPFMYVLGTLVSFFVNIELKRIIVRSKKFLIYYTFLATISTIISYFIFDDYEIDGPRGLAFYVMMFAFLIYIIISIYDKLFNIKMEDN